MRVDAHAFINNDSQNILSLALNHYMQKSPYCSLTSITHFIAGK
jgi:hypothetical protein